MTVTFLFALVATSAAPMTQAWHADLMLLERELPRRHLDFFRSISPEKFHASVHALDAQLPALTLPEFAVGVLRIVALAGRGNGHTYVLKGGDSTADIFLSERNTPDAMENLRALGFGQLPVGFYLFKDGLYVRTASSGYESLLGAKVLRLGNRSAEEALREVGELVTKDNPQGVAADGPRYLAVPEILQGLGMTADAQSVELQVQTKSGIVKRTLARVPLETLTVSDMQKTPALYTRHRDRYFWSERLAGHGVHYVQWNAMRDAPNEKLDDFMLGEIDAFDQGDATKLVLDLRFNPGGNTSLTTPILLRLIRSPKLRQRGSLFIVIGRETFSAAMNFCNTAERFTPAIFVGEPTGGSPGFFGDNAALTLPRTKLQVRISKVWWQLMDSRDTRQWLPPEIAAEPTALQYANGVDPVLEAIFADVPAPDYAQQVMSAAKTRGVAGVDAVLSAWKKDDRARYLDLEQALNVAGYAALGAGQTQQAIAIFDRAVALYPNAGNLFDSRAEAYAAAGDVATAITSYQRALALDPKNFNAEAQLARLFAAALKKL